MSLPPHHSPPDHAAANGAKLPPLNDPHRRGKIARLPKPFRDQINQMLRDGAAYGTIIQKLNSTPGALPYPISQHNLSQWKRGGYQHWLAQQEWREDMRAKQADAVDLLHESESPKLHEVSLQLAVMRVFELLQRFQATLSSSLQDLPPAFHRLLAALPRICREALRYQKYRDACLQARLKLQALRDPKRKLNDAERIAVVDCVDELLGVACPDLHPAESEPPPTNLP